MYFSVTVLILHALDGLTNPTRAWSSQNCGKSRAGILKIHKIETASEKTTTDERTAPSRPSTISSRTPHPTKFKLKLKERRLIVGTFFAP